jgi:D-3-phosphoglycerate dehydrogenase
MVINQVQDFMENGDITNAVNFPELNLSLNSKYRISIFNQNTPAMISKNSQQFAQAGLNIVMFSMA